MTRRSFRPQLEVLEYRDAPASLSSQTNLVNSDFNTLKNDVNTAVNNAPTNGNYSTVNGDLGKLQGDFNGLKSQTTSTQNFLTLLTFAAFEGGTITNPFVDLFLFTGFSQVNTAKNLINSLPGQVSAEGNTQGTFTSPFTFNQVNFIETGAGPLTLS